MKHTIWRNTKQGLTLALTGLMLMTSVPVMSAPDATAYAAVDATTRAQIEESLYNAEYYAKANEDVAVALNNNEEALYRHWLDYGKAEGRNASMVFNAKYYLEVNPSVAAEVGNDYVAAYEHFVNEGLQAGLESSPVFSVKYYLEANQDVAEAFNGDYVSAAKHFNENAIAEGRSGSGNFDYTVYRACNTDVEELYGDYIEGYYIHYINHGRAEGRTGGLSGSGTSSGGIDTTAPSYRIFDAEYYLDRYPSLETEVGTDPDTLYKYWIEEGIAQGQTASPVIVPEEYLELNQDVAEVFGRDYAAVINHFLTSGILEGRTGSKEFDYSIYADCNTDVGGVFDDDIVGYYFHYVKYGKAEERTAAVYVPETTPDLEPEYVQYSTFELGGEIESFGKSEGGVVIVKKDGLWGAVDYTGKEILPAEYKNFTTSPNEEGYFCFGDDEIAWIFDNQGKEVMNLDYYSDNAYGGSELYGLYIHEGVATITHQYVEYGDDFIISAADLTNEKFIKIDTDACDAIYMTSGLTAMQDGKMYFSMDHSLYSADRNGNVTLVYENPFADGIPGGTVIYRRAPRDGYGTVRLTNDLEYGYRVGVISTDGKDVCLFNLSDYYDMFGFENGETWANETFYIDGQYYTNIDKKMVVRFIRDGETFTNVFLDLDKAEYSYHEVMAGKYSFGTEKLVSNPEDIIVAQYDDIVLSEDGIHYVYNDGTYFYIDDDGKVLATYKECCPFYNGYAAVIDHNGDAYVINTKFERVSEIFEAEYASTLGEVHLFNNGTTNRMVVIE